MEERIVNFSAGPAGLPLTVLEKVQDELLCYPGAGASVMEISHRSAAFDAIHAGAKANIAKLLNLPDNYKVLFLQGGATMQFIMLGMNFLKGNSADYVVTGSWGQKAVSEAKNLGTPRIAWDGKADNFNNVPADGDLKLSDDAAYVHYTSNETIQGVQFKSEISVGDKPLFCDCSSDFLSRPVDINKYALLYAGAQKNVGPAGIAVTIIRDDMLDQVPEKLPSLLDYKLMAENDSLYNTPPCFAIYMIGETTKWLLDTFGTLEKIGEHNAAKAKILYDAIDNSNGFYKGHAVEACRSDMNVTFVLANTDLDGAFVKEATAKGLDGLKGHRSVGGFRASIYNAMPVAGCEALRDFMADFQKRNG